MKGIVGVSFTNIISLFISMLISFILPLFLSVEGYGYWQLYVLYAGYVGILAFGFNDGIHLNYAGRDYNESLWHEESTYIRFLTIMSIIETIIVNVVLALMQFDNITKYENDSDMLETENGTFISYSEFDDNATEGQNITAFNVSSSTNLY